MNQATNKFRTGGGLAAILLWSTTFAFARSLSEQVGPLTTGAAVYLIGGVACLLRLRLSGGRLTGFLALPRWYLFGCGSLFVFYTAAIYLAVGMAADRGQVLEIALVNYLWPTLTILLSLALLGKKGQPAARGRDVVFHASVFHHAELRLSQGITRPQALARLHPFGVRLPADMAFDCRWPRAGSCVNGGIYLAGHAGP